MNIFPANKIANQICKMMYSDYTMYNGESKNVTVKLVESDDTLSLWELSALTVMKLRTLATAGDYIDPVKYMFDIIELCERISIKRIGGQRVVPLVMRVVKLYHFNGSLYKEKNEFIDGICEYASHAKLHAIGCEYLRNTLSVVLPSMIDLRAIHDVTNIVMFVLENYISNVSTDRRFIIAFALCEFVSLSLDPTNNIY